MLPLSKAKLKFFISLQRKKYRSQHRMFLAEGQKVLFEGINSSYPLEAVVIREGDLLPAFLDVVPEDKIMQAAQADFNKLSTQVQPEGVLGIFHFPPPPLFQLVPQLTVLPEMPALVLEDIRDPGNLGTLLRTADWFGFPSLICSATTAEAFNPKVVRAAMGALFRTQITYVEDFQGFISNFASQTWAADIEGTPLPEADLKSRPLILLGNEANGLSQNLRNLPNLDRVTIPRYGQGESLNVAIAAGILLSQWRLG